jgi:pimeloyl-ACP methyl ester carboxylesterase
MSKWGNILRTADDRFDGLPGYEFAPHYIDSLPEYEGLRLHYLDEGPRDAETTFLCLHGQPSWSYLYRKMVPLLSAAGHRVIAPDWFGFGRSDKPEDDAVYTFDFHRNALLAFFRHMQLSNVCLVLQDWGGLLGLTIPHEFPDQITRMIVMNTGLGVGVNPGPGFMAWKAYAASQHDLDIAALMARSSPNLSEAEAQAYAAPYPDARYKGGVRRFPELVPIEPDMDGVAVSKMAARYFSQDWTGETFMAVGMQDPVLGPDAMTRLARLIRGCPPPLEIAEAGHFVQEWGDVIVPKALAHFQLSGGI